jgi:hypothetical protein
LFSGNPPRDTSVFGQHSQRMGFPTPSNPTSKLPGRAVKEACICGRAQSDTAPFPALPQEGSASRTGQRVPPRSARSMRSALPGERCQIRRGLRPVRINNTPFRAGPSQASLSRDVQPGNAPLSGCAGEKSLFRAVPSEKVPFPAAQSEKSPFSGHAVGQIPFPGHEAGHVEFEGCRPWVVQSRPPLFGQRNPVRSPPESTMELAKFASGLTPSCGSKCTEASIPGGCEGESTHGSAGSRSPPPFSNRPGDPCHFSRHKIFPIFAGKRVLRAPDKGGVRRTVYHGVARVVGTGEIMPNDPKLRTEKRVGGGNLALERGIGGEIMR